MIVIPMAGMSSRFFKAGFDKPKYMLDAHAKPLFDYAVESFKAYFSTEHFLFIIRDVYQTADFVKQRAEYLGIASFEVKVLDDETRGQAETVFLGTQHIEEKTTSMTIFNIDTFRPDFRYPKEITNWSGYLEVFTGSGDNWSFAKPISEQSTQVIETAEKRPISNLCSTGLYYFSSLSSFQDAYIDYLNKPQDEWEKGELYIAPLYNYLISKGEPIHYNLINRDEVIFCGVPDEYYEFLECPPLPYSIK